MTARLPEYGPIDTVICDIDGVVVLGTQPITGAGDSLAKIREAGLEIVFATNNSTRRPEMVRKHVLDVIGFDPGPDAVVTSGAATAELLGNDYRQVLVVGTDGLRGTLRGSGVGVTTDWRMADAVVVGLDPAATYDVLADAALAIQNGAAFFATNSDASFPRPDGLYPGAGAIVAALTTTVGQQPVAVCGKPHSPMRRALARRAGSHPLIIGDRPDTDIAIGKAEGWATVLTLTGVVRDPEEVAPELRADFVVDSIVELPELLGL
jgi:4-nitrophenyl phosphatase